MNSFSRFVLSIVDLFGRIPESLIAFLARFSLGAVFWKAGQTKIEGLRIDIVDGYWHWGIPTLSDNAVYLFTYEYQLPWINPVLAAALAAIAEHLFAIFLLIGFATRFGAFALLIMTMIIQFLVYPGAYATHGLWAALLLYLIARGPGVISVDHFWKVRVRG